MFRGDKRKKKVKSKTQNEKMVETDMDIWYYTYKKTVIKARKSVSNHKNNLQFAFKGPTYVKNIVFFVDFLADF